MVESNSIALRPVVPEDEDFLFHLYCVVRAPEFAFLALPEQQKTPLLRMQYNAQQSAYRGQYPGSEHQLVLHDGKAAGRIWVAQRESEFCLLDIALLAECRNQGIGTFLISRLQAQARMARKPVRSSVFRFNAGSLRLHERLGFQVASKDEIQFQMEWAPGNTQETELRSESA